MSSARRRWEKKDRLRREAEYEARAPERAAADQRRQEYIERMIVAGEAMEAACDAGTLDKNDHAGCWQFIVDHMAKAAGEDCPGCPINKPCPEIAMVHTIMEPFRPLPEHFVGHHTVSVVSTPEKPRKTMAEILAEIHQEPVSVIRRLPVEIEGPQYEHTDINRLTQPELP